jgi:hypothetical protein
MLGRSRYGCLRLSELPGFLCILLAGPTHRRAAAAVLAARARKTAAPQVPAPMSRSHLDGSFPIASRQDLDQAAEALRRGRHQHGTWYCGVCRERHRMWGGR